MVTVMVHQPLRQVGVRHRHSMVCASLSVLLLNYFLLSDRPPAHPSFRTTSCFPVRSFIDLRTCSVHQYVLSVALSHLLCPDGMPIWHLSCSSHTS